MSDSIFQQLIYIKYLRTHSVVLLDYRLFFKQKLEFNLIF